MAESTLVRITPIRSAYELATETGANDPAWIKSFLDTYRAWKLDEGSEINVEISDPNLLYDKDPVKSDTLVYFEKGAVSYDLITPIKYKGESWVEKSVIGTTTHYLQKQMAAPRQINTQQNIWMETFGKDWQKVYASSKGNFFNAIETYSKPVLAKSEPRVVLAHQPDPSNKLFGFLRINADKDKTRLIFTESIKNFEESDDYLKFEIDESYMGNYSTTLQVPTHKGVIRLQLINGNIVKLSQDKQKILATSQNTYKSGKLTYTISMNSKGAIVDVA